MTASTLPLATPPAQPVPALLSGPDRAALIVRLALDMGASLPLADLPQRLQERLADHLSRLGAVERDVIDATVADFAAQLDAMGAVFAPGMEAALKLLEGHVDPILLDKLRRTAGSPPTADPWEALAALPPERLAAPLAAEHPATAALALTRLPVPLASRVLSEMNGADARRIAAAVRGVGDVPEMLAVEIGEALVAALVGGPSKDEAPRQVAAMLDAGTLQTRTALLDGLEEVDAAFAASVRSFSFGFADIAARVEPGDVPAILRDVPQDEQADALAAALAGGGKLHESAEFLLASLPGRLADRLREAAEESVADADRGETAMRAVAMAVKAAEDRGETRLKPLP